MDGQAESNMPFQHFLKLEHNDPQKKYGLGTAFEWSVKAKKTYQQKELYQYLSSWQDVLRHCGPVQPALGSGLEPVLVSQVIVWACIVTSQESVA